MGVNSLPKTVTRQRRGCDLNLGPSAPESSTLTTQLPSHPNVHVKNNNYAASLLFIVPQLYLQQHDEDIIIIIINLLKKFFEKN